MAKTRRRENDSGSEVERRLRAAKRRLEQRLLLQVATRALAAESGTDAYGFENIVGVGISEKLVDNQFSGQLSVVVYVIAKKPVSRIDPKALVPRDVDGVPTDVVATGELHALPFRGRYRPAPGGVSVGHTLVTVGTIGCLVRRGRRRFVLSNNHVLANANDARAGDAILQPGRADGGQPRDQVAALSEWVPLRFGGTINQVDCAIGEATDALVGSTNQCFGRINPAPVRCRREMLVKKCGRTTQLTRGRVTDCDATLWVNYGAQRALFQNQIVIVSLSGMSFSAGGDSGSLILTDNTMRPVGLLFAGSATHTVANPVGRVLSALNVTIVA